MFHQNLIKFETGGVYITINSRMNFGLYSGERIIDILEMDSKYIIELYKSGKIKPDKELKNIIKQTIKEIKERYMDRIGNIFNGMKFEVDQPIHCLENLFETNKYIEVEIYKINVDNVIKIYYKNVVIARLNKIFKVNYIPHWELELEPTSFLDKNIFVFKTYNKLFKTLIKTTKYFLRFTDNQWILYKE